MQHSPLSSCDTLISAKLAVTQNAEREIIEDAAIAVSAGKIIAIGAHSELKQRYTTAQTIELGNAVLLPGLINTHTHAPMTLLRGIADDLPLMEWLTGHIFTREARLTPHMLQVGAALACAEMIRTGTTAFLDMYLAEHEIFDVIDQSGLKARLGEGFSQYPGLAYTTSAEAFALVRSQHEKLKHHPRLQTLVCPHSVYTTTSDILEKCSALAAELKLPLHIHMAETITETTQCLDMHGCRPVEQCRRTGILGPNTSAAHVVDVNEAEITLLKESGTSVAHNPKSNMKLASGAAPIPNMLRAGVCVGLGTDGSASNNTLNMFHDMNACALLHKLVHLDPTLMNAQTVLDMATLNGAEMLGLSAPGCLEAGKAADIIALSLQEPHMNPLHNIVSQLVYTASGHEVNFSMVDGKVLYSNGKLHSLDYEEIRREANDIALWFRQNT